jgi:hypothetical protein
VCGGCIWLSSTGVSRWWCMDRQTALAWGRFAQGWKAFIEDFGWLPREKLWVNFLANNQELAGRLGFEVDPAAHWPATQSGCLTPCVICDAPEENTEFAGFETADSHEELRLEAAGQAKEHPCVGCWTESAEAHRELSQAEELGATLRALFFEGSISNLD